MSENRKGDKANFYGKKHSPENLANLREKAKNWTKDPRPGFQVEVTDLKSMNTKVYKSMREVTRDLNTHMSTITRRE